MCVRHDNVFRITMVLLACNVFIMTTCWVQLNVIERTQAPAKASADLSVSQAEAISGRLSACHNNGETASLRSQ